MTTASTETPAHNLPENAGAILLALARDAIAAQFGMPAAAQKDHAWLRQPGASFVTLTRNGKLRGCIGTLEARRPLEEDVAHNAVAAALRDPRFAPLTREELADINVEVSVLSPLQRITYRDEDDALAQLRPAIDGVIFEAGHHKATFLPQVWQDLKDAPTFMRELKYKAGLPPDFWRPDIKLSRYTVSKWQEAGAASPQSEYGASRSPRRGNEG